MKTCKDCIYSPMCRNCNYYVYNRCRCEKFKDRSKFIELPYFIGDKVYTVIYQKVYEAEVICIRPFVFKDYVEYRGNVIITFEDPFYHDGRPLEQELFVVFGKDTFLNKEEAEKKLEEMSGQI